MSHTRQQPGLDRPQTPPTPQVPQAPSPHVPPPPNDQDGFFTAAEAETRATAPLGTGHQVVRAWIFSLAVLIGAALVAAGFATGVHAVQWLGIAMVVVPGGFGLANHIWYGSERVDRPR